MLQTQRFQSTVSIRLMHKYKQTINMKILGGCYFVLVFFGPFGVAITSLGEERASLGAFRTFVRFVLVWICRFPLPLGVWEGLRCVVVALAGLFSCLFLLKKSTDNVAKGKNKYSFGSAERKAVTGLTTLWANSADAIFVVFMVDLFPYFFKKTGFDISCKLSPLEKIRMTHQILFSWNKKEKKS